MKKIKKRIKGKVVFNTSPTIKMSELIAEYASDYINMGETTEERQNCLNGACTAWNIANLPEHLREKALHHAAAVYRKMNSEINDADDYLHDMKILIQEKLQKFPEIKKVIIYAFVEPINDKQYRINVVSTDNPGRLFKC